MMVSGACMADQRARRQKRSPGRWQCRHPDTCSMASRSERGSHASQRQPAVDAIAAYLADEDAEVYNLTEAAVRTDALMAALHLTGLAAAAVRALADVTGESPQDVLRLLSQL
jgi:hypothetical protein